MQLTEKQLTNFWKKVNKTDLCWLWTATLDKDGYGRFWLSSKAYRPSHVISHLIHGGNIPEGHVVHHKCYTPSCVNPHHLEAVTQKQNLHDVDSKTLPKLNSEKLYCPVGHPYDEKNTYWGKGKYGLVRYCLICRRNRDREAQRRYRAQRRAITESVIG